jgi:hypothetical protein
MVIDPHGSSNVDKFGVGLGGFGYLPTQFLKNRTEYMYLIINIELITQTMDTLRSRRTSRFFFLGHI